MRAPAACRRTGGRRRAVIHVPREPKIERLAAPWRYAVALGFVLVSAAAAELLYRLTGSTRLSMIYLAGVLVAAYVLGSGPAYLTAAISFLLYNFYLVEPQFTLRLGSAEDFVTLGVFLAAAMLTGNLTGRVRDQAARAQAQAQATAGLFEATREFSASVEEAAIRDRLANHLARLARGQALVRDEEQLFLAPAAPAVKPAVLGDALALARASGETTSVSVADHWTLRPLQTEEGRFGVAAWRTFGREALTEDQQTLLDILADVGAAAIARARLAAGKSEAEARVRTEDLRNSLLSSISHDLRTPLAAILASASSLHAFGDSFAPEVRKDLAATIEEEAVRLDAFVANLLNMSRLQSGAVSIQRIPFSVVEVIRSCAERRSRAHGREVGVNIDPDLPEGLGDPVLFEQALGNVVDNAIHYGPAAGPVVVSAQHRSDRLCVEVLDEGPGVSVGELEGIFQKFYRAASGHEKPGTGLGLAIARGLVEGMGGTVQAHNRTDVACGLVVTLALPVAPA